MVSPSQPFGGTDAEGKGRENRKAEKDVDQVRHRKLRPVCLEEVGENRVRKLWENRRTRVKGA